MKRLIERRYILTASRASTGIAAAYWASLGLSPETAEKNLQKCRVRIQSIAVDGATELEAALKELGVRVVKRSPDMTITLVNDYLEAQLEEVNRQHLAEATSWLLVQPSGLFPLVGPVLRPGSGACWTCIAERMKRNREVKALLDRRQAHCITVSPLARHAFGHSAIQLAALEIAKAIASDFRTELNNNIMSLDLLGSTVVKHHVATRPQCPECGRKKLRDPRRAPSPIEIGKGGKLVMTSGGYRSVSPAATVARFRRHVSPLTGVVSRLERIQADLPMNTNYHAAHNFVGPTESVHELRAGLSSGSFGKGSTAEQGEASALMEAIERYSGIFQGDEIRAKRRFIDFAPDEAIAPNQVFLFSDAQLQQDQSPEAPQPEAVPALFDPSAKIDWSPVWSLRDERFKYLPTSLLYFFYRGEASFAQFRTAVRPAIRSKRRSSKASSSWSNGMPMRSGGTIVCRGPNWISANSTIPISASCASSSRKPAAGFGCSTSPAISKSRLSSRSRIGCKMEGRISNSVPALISMRGSL